MTRRGVILSSAVKDMKKSVIKRFDLKDGVVNWLTTAEWADRFLGQGFELAVTDSSIARRIWRVEERMCDGGWYQRPECLSNCFFTKVNSAPVAVPRRESHTPVRLDFASPNGGISAW